MRNKPLPGLIKRRSPLRQIDTTRGDVDTTWADKVYTKTKVDEELTKSGHHTGKGIRGKMKKVYNLLRREGAQSMLSNVVSA